MSAAMKQKDLLTALSLLAIVLVAMHIADDYVQGGSWGLRSRPGVVGGAGRRGPCPAGE